MKTTLYLSKFKKKQSAEYQKSIDIFPDEIIIWDGDNSKLPCEISSVPCLFVDMQGAIEEIISMDPETDEEIKTDMPIRNITLEHRKNEKKVKTILKKRKLRVKAK